MRNHITPDESAWANASRQAHFAATAANSNQRLDLVHDERAEPAAGAIVDSPASVLPASDFEGFGSFS